MKRSQGTRDPDVVIDARAQRCPVPVIRLARAANETRAGTLLRVLADDPAARADIPAWCRMKGHTVTTTDHDGAEGGTEGAHTAYDVLLGGHGTQR